MAKGFTAMLKGLGKPAQPDQRALTPDLRPPTRPQLRWRSASDYSHGTKPLSKQGVAGDNNVSTAITETFEFNIPTVEPSMLNEADEESSSNLPTARHCFELPADAATPTLDTPTSSFSTMTASSLDSTPPASRCSNPLESRVDSRLGSAAGQDCRIVASEDFIETPSGQFVLPELAKGLATGSPIMRDTFMFGDAEHDLYQAKSRPKSFVWRDDDAAATTARPAELRRASTHRLSTMSPLSVRLPVRPDPRRCRSAETQQQASSSVAAGSGPAYQSMAAAIATTVPASTTSSRRSSVVVAKRQSRQRKFNSGQKPAPLILSRASSPIGPPPSLPPAYPPPPNPLQRVEMRVADLEEQLHMLSLKIAALNTFADAAIATAT